MDELIRQLLNALETGFKEYGPEATLYGPEGVAMKMISQGLSEIETRLKVIDEDINIGAEDFTPYGALGYWNDVYEKISNVNESLGVAGNLGKSLKHEFKEAYVGLADIGVEAETLGKNVKKFLDDYGRVTLLSSQELIEMSSMAKVFGEDSIAILATYRDLGLSIETTTARMKKLTLESNKYGVLPSKAIKLIKDNLDKVDRYYFKGGTKAFEQMALKAASLNNDMKGAFTMIDKILDGGVEGAVEMAQNFQIMGGPIAKMGNVFDLISMSASGDAGAINDMLAKAGAEMATIGKNGEITFGPGAMMQMREWAKTNGESIEDITKRSKAMFKEMNVGKQLDLSLRKVPEDFEAMSKKVAGAVSGMDAFGNWLVVIDGIEKKVQDLTEDDINAKLSISPEGDEKDTFKDITKSNMDLGEIINKLIAQLKVTALSSAGEVYQNLIGTAQKTADNMVATLKPFAESFSKLSEGAYNNFKPILEGLSGGNIGEALLGAATNLGKVAATFLLITSPAGMTVVLATSFGEMLLPYFMESITVLKNLMWNASQYIVGGITYLVDYAILEIKKFLYPFYEEKMPTFEENMKKWGFETVDLLQDTAILKGYKDVPGLTYMQSQDLRSKLAEDPSKGVYMKDLGGTVFEHKLTGEITVQMPDGSTRTLTAEEIPMVMEAVKDLLKNSVNKTK
jgi:hypothetical protein